MIIEEWDDKYKLSIRFIIDGICQVLIGVTSAGPGGAGCFCGKLQCVTVTNWKSQVKVPSNYWFIQSGARSFAGLLSYTRLPSIELGCTVPKSFESLVSDSHSIF